MERLNLKDKIMHELGFSYQFTRDEKDWKNSIFEKRDETPSLSIGISKHKTYGTNFWINHVPYDSLYHFTSGKPTTDEETFRLLKKYIESTQHARKKKNQGLFLP